MLSVYGIAAFVIIFGGMLWNTARRWRYLARHYASGTASSTIRSRHMQSAVLIGLGGYNSLKGIVTIGVSHAGVSLRVMPVFSLFHSPLFIPHEEIQGWATDWYIDGESTELQFRKAPNVKIVVPSETAEWIQGSSGRKMTLSVENPPTGKAGQGWRALVLVHCGVAIFMLAWLASYYVLGPII